MIIPYLSICIPTNGRLDILENTIKSIYSNYCKKNYSDFEVIISDNSKDSSSASLLNKYNYPNLFYYKSDSIGFLNSVAALEKGKGMLLKLHNNYTIFLPNSLSEIISFIKDSLNEKPLIYFSNNFAGFYTNRYFYSFDNFANNLSYLSSWSTGISIWKEDFERIKAITLYNQLFPHTSLLFTQSYKKSYMIMDKKLFYNQKTPNKGGYNLFKAFTIDFISILQNAYNKQIISKNTFIYIKSELLFNFLPFWYFKTVILRKFNYDLTDIKKNILINYSKMEYLKFIRLSFLSPITFLFKKIF